MTIETYKCIKQRYNPNMGMECFSDDHTIFFIDRNGWVVTGDVVKCERDEEGFYRRIWVNDVLKTNNHFEDVNKI